MGSDYFACTSWIMTYEDVESVLPDQVAALKKALGSVSFEVIGKALYDGGFENMEDEWISAQKDQEADNFDVWMEGVSTALDNLVRAAQERYRIALVPGWLDWGCHSRYDTDELGGKFFWVTGAVVFRPEVKPIQAKLIDARWVDYG